MVVEAMPPGLRYVRDSEPGIRRTGSPPRFRYTNADGTPAAEADVERARKLVIPPAWTDVWICESPRGHLQATGRDARGRKQYRYHARWRQLRDDVKYGRLIAFASALPRIRARTRADLKRPGLRREKVLAAVVQLLEKTLIRVGNDEYARQNGSVGLTTMRDGHARVNGSKVRFEFRGKSGIQHAIDLSDRRLARLVKACRDLPGYELFQYVDQAGRRQAVDSADVNAYLRDICAADFTAKDFRTWFGTVLAARALAGTAGFATAHEAKRNVVKAVDAVARILGNTRSVCQKSYIHPAVIDSYFDGVTLPPSRNGRRSHGLTADERAVVALVSARHGRKAA
jgi:DNA topoisomerase-1